MDEQHFRHFLFIAAIQMCTLGIRLLNRHCMHALQPQGITGFPLESFRTGKNKNFTFEALSDSLDDLHRSG